MTIGVWDAWTGQVASEPFEGTNVVVSVAFSPDRKTKLPQALQTRQSESGISNLAKICPTTFTGTPVLDLMMAPGLLVVGPHEELLFWVPKDLQAGLWRPSNTVIAPNSISQNSLLELLGNNVPYPHCLESLILFPVLCLILYV